MDRPATAAFLGMSLDGFIAGPHDELDWLERGGGPPEDHGFGPFFASIDQMLIGRRTWDVVQRFPTWPYEGKAVAVLTRRPGETRHGERHLSGMAGEVLAALGRDGARRVYVDGGAVVSQFLAAGLLDELTVSILPVVLGAGIPLFQGTGPERWLSLRSHQAWPSGLVQLRYERRDA
jgi:dihydrofolate reductase